MKKPNNLTIHIMSGVIDSIEGMPEDWTYTVVEHGND